MSQTVFISKPETIQEILVNATRALGATMEYHEARLQAELLLAHSLQTTRTMVLARLDETVTPEVAARYAANVARRAKHEPLAYILGHQEFFGLDFIVDRRVLIPRHETEIMVELALNRARHAPNTSPVIVDVGTGSGAVALTLAYHLSQARVFAIDQSPDALQVAQMNAAQLHLQERVIFLQGNLLEPLTEPFDLLVANLPYIPTERLARLPREVRAFEPRSALDGGEDGLVFVQQLLGQLKFHAARGATVLLEISEEQGKVAMKSAWLELPYVMARLHQDLEGLDRVVEIQFAG